MPHFSETNCFLRRILRQIRRNLVAALWQSLFRQWTQLNRDAHGVSEEECDAAVDLMADIESQMAREPVTCIADYAAKILAVTAYGVFGLSGGQTGDAVLAEAKELVSATT